MKLAAVIASELNIKAQNVHSVTDISKSTDIFLGSGLYLLRPSKLVREFIRSHDFKGKRVALFGTSTTGIGIETLGMEILLKRKGAIITDKYYCPGQFCLHIAGKSFFVRKDKPSVET